MSFRDKVYDFFIQCLLIIVAAIVGAVAGAIVIVSAWIRAQFYVVTPAYWVWSQVLAWVLGIVMFGYSAIKFAERE